MENKYGKTPQQRLEEAMKQPEQKNIDIFGLTHDDAMNVVMSKLRHELKKDKLPGSYFHSWQCNTAMAFVDAFNKYAEDNEVLGSAKNFDIHKIANQAAINFLELLCSQSNSLEKKK